jgi:hypothetical protein
MQAGGGGQRGGVHGRSGRPQRLQQPSSARNGECTEGHVVRHPMNIYDDYGKKEG